MRRCARRSSTITDAASSDSMRGLVEGDQALGRPRQVRDDRADARIQGLHLLMQRQSFRKALTDAVSIGRIGGKHRPRLLTWRYLKHKSVFRRAHLRAPEINFQVQGRSQFEYS